MPESQKNPLLRKPILPIAFAIATLLGLPACGEKPLDVSNTADSQTTNVTPASVEPDTVDAASFLANELFERIFEEQVALSPNTLTYLGREEGMDSWNDLSEAHAVRVLELHKQQLAELQSLPYDKLDSATRLSYQLLEQQLENDIADYRWRNHNYPVNHLSGLHTEVPSLLINSHRISKASDADNYVARLSKVEQLFEQLLAGLDTRAKLGIAPPKFVYPLVIDSSRNLISGAPFDEGEDSPLLADFRGKITSLGEEIEITEAQQQAWIAAAEKALLESVKPAYEKLIAYMTEQEKTATEEAGAWQWPDGDEFYNVALQRTTTTDLSAEEIHQIGLSEVNRIHSEMESIRESVGFEGDLRAFMDAVRDDKSLLYPNTDEGRQEYIDHATALIDNMKSRLDELFITKPKAALVVKRVEPFREQSAGTAFYQSPSEDGTRPGIYYVNLHNMNYMPKYRLEALAYHEGAPGHHMQLAIQQELQDIPKFRRFGRYTAYSEGWGLYSELLPKEIGLYEDPYSDFGRLALELWRACRMVVDTGIHAKKWTHQQGSDFYTQNTPYPASSGAGMTSRHIVWPSQATAYKVGMLKIVELREKARAALGERFDIRVFHDEILRHGPLPMDVLEQKVDALINATMSQPE